MSYKIHTNDITILHSDIYMGTDFSEGFKACKGRLWPFGFLKLLTSGRKTKMIVLLLGAVDQRYQGRGIDVYMGIKMLESAKKQGYKYIDSHLELETNTKVRAEMERMGGVIFKKYRIYQKDL